MTQFNTTLTTAAPRKTTESLAVRLMRPVTIFRQRCAALFAPSEVYEADYFCNFEARKW